MIEVVLQGQTLKANLLNPEVSKRYEDGFDKVVKTFDEAAKCERAICKQHIASPAENRCNQKKPSTTPLKWYWASLLSCFGAFFEDKTA